MPQNAYFRLTIKDDGLYVQVFPAVDFGEPVSFFDVNLYLARVRVERFDREKLKHALTYYSGRFEVKISDDFVAPADEILSVKLYDDKMQASVRVYPASTNGRQMGKGEFLEHLSAAGIKYGVREEAVDEWLQNRRYCTDIPIAEGTPAEKSRDAVIEYYFNTDDSFRPDTDEQGNIDFHKLNLLNHVETGDILAVLTPAYEGIPGTNVAGARIPSVKPVKKRLKYSGNADLSEDGCVLKSAVSGHVELQAGTVVVRNVYTIRGNVGPGTGDVDYDGTVMVTGDVQTGYSVKATGDIFVNGIMEAATLLAGGRIVLAKGMHGEAKGVLDAGGDIVAKFIQMSTVFAGGSVSSNSILHSNVSAKDSILADYNPGIITGGELRAKTLISAKVVGAASATGTLLEAGPDPSDMEALRNLEKLLVEKRTEQRRLRRLISGDSENAAQASREMSPLESRMNTTDIETEELLAHYNRLKEEINLSGAGKIAVKDVVHEGTKIVISGISYYVRDAVSSCRFVKEGAEVKCYSLR